MNKLCFSYEKYYAHPTVDNSQNLLNEIINFDFKTYWEFVKEMRTVSRGGLYKSLTMHSGTSSNTVKTSTYQFGPNYQFWISNIENFIKNPTNRLVVFINVMFLVKPCGILPTAIDHDLYDYHINGNWYGDTQSLCKGLNSLSQQNKLLITSDPKVLLYLSRDSDFLDHAEAMGWHLASTSTEAFFPRNSFKKRSIYVNDNMIDWTNGLNFFECPYGTKHFIPIFLERTNLLNLVGNEGDDDDVWQLEQSISKCDCGKNYLKITFMPHKSVAIIKKNGDFLYEPTFAESLEGSYLCFQFVQHNDDKLKVLYTGTMPERDKVVTSEFIERHGFQCYEFIENKFMYTSENEKTAAFYRNVKNKHILDFPYRWRPLKIAL